MTKERVGLCIAVIVLCVAGASAADIPRVGPDEFRTNPALPSPGDLVRFDDDTPVVQLAPFEPQDVNQKAFPANYDPPVPTGQPAPAAVAQAAAPDAPSRYQVVSSAPPVRTASVDDTPDLGLLPGGTGSLLDGSMPTPLPPPAELRDQYRELGGQTAAVALPQNPDRNPVAPPTIAPTAQPRYGLGPGTADEAVSLAELNAHYLPDNAQPPLPELPARTPAPATYPKPDIAQVRADFNRVKTFCEANSLGSAAEIYARMPPFGDDAETNRLRADSANLIILGLARADNLGAARRIYESVPTAVVGPDAMLAKARSVINLATYYVRAERYSDAYDVLMDVGKIQNRSALNNELFRLMARMVPYLDNADATDKARNVYDLLLGEIRSPGTAALFAENMQGVIKYYLHYVDKSEAPVPRRRRLDFLEYVFTTMGRYRDNPDIRMVRKTLGESIAARYAGNPERAAKFYEEG